MKDLELVSQEFGETVKGLRECTPLTRRLVARILRSAFPTPGNIERFDAMREDLKVRELFAKVCRSNDTGLARAFISNGALALNHLTNLDRLLESGQHKRKEIVTALLQAGVLVADDPRGQQMLSAVVSGEKKLVKRLLKLGYDPNAVTSFDLDDYSALKLAVNNNDYCLVKKLLNHNAQVDLGYETPLMFACELNHHKIVELLLQFGADVNYVNEDRGNPISSAFGNIKITNLLLEAGANIDAKDIDCKTCLMYAAGHGNKNLVEFYLSKGADVNATDCSVDESDASKTALTMAACMGHAEIVDLLLKKGSNINFQSTLRLTTALIEAAIFGRKEVVQLLLVSGANSKVIDSEGKTALAYAQENGHDEIAELLSSGYGKV